MSGIYDTLVEFFLTKPNRIIVLGRVILWAGFIPLITGLFLRIGTVAVNILPTLAHGAPDTKNVADLYPMFPTWWIPENFVPFSLLLLVAICGFLVALTGKNLAHQFTRF